MVKTLSFENIDKRLDLYLEYLKYYVEEKTSHKDLFDVYRRTGNMYYSSHVTMIFEQFLAFNEHYDLIVSTGAGLNI